MAEIFSIILSVPHQELLRWTDGSTTPVQNLTSILKGHEILLFFITCTIHIPKRIAKRKKYSMRDATEEITQTSAEQTPEK